MRECLIAIVWATDISNPEDMSYGLLAYNGGNGPVRVYHRNQYDERCDLGRNREADGPLPYFTRWQDARRFMLASPERTQVQVSIEALRRVFRDTEFSDPPGPRQCDRDGPAYNIGIAVAFVLAMLFAGPAVAQESSADHDARVAFESGHVAFAEGRYEDALDDFTHAYDLSRHSMLLYNIGLAADRLRRDEDAIAAFERYLLATPDADNRAEVQGRLRALRDAVAAEAALEAAEAEAAEAEVEQALTAPVPTTPPSTPIYEEWWLWTVVGCVAALAIAVPVGIVVGSSTGSEPFITGDVGPGGIVIALEGP